MWDGEGVGRKDMGLFYPGGVPRSGFCKLVREPREHPGGHPARLLAACGIELALGKGKDLT